jgi:hypothetical protein
LSWRHEDGLLTVRELGRRRSSVRKQVERKLCDASVVPPIRAPRTRWQGSRSRAGAPVRPPPGDRPSAAGQIRSRWRLPAHPPGRLQFLGELHDA